MRFDGRLVVVTGGTGFLGCSVVQRVTDEGAEVYIPVFQSTELERFSLRDHERVTLVDGIDLSDADSTQSFYNAVEGSGKHLWASIHIAGGFAMGPICEVGADVYQQMLTMNALTAYMCSREAVRLMRAGDGGRLVNTCARPGVSPDQGANMVAYASSKAAVGAMTEALAAELRLDRILVNAIAPSVMDTPANRGAMPDADHGAWPKVEEVAEAISFLASPQNVLTSGVVMPVYGRS